MSIWQEIDKLRQEIKTLERRLARQSVIIAQHSQVRIGKILASADNGYAVQEITIAGGKTEAYTDVQTLPGETGPVVGSSVAFGVDENGERYLFPSPIGVILVQDQGGGTGRHVEKDENGTVTVPEGSETFPLVVAEPAGQFHSSTPSIESGRIYPGMRLSSADGETSYYLIFLAGYGPSTMNFSVEIDTITVTISTDYAGKLKTFTAS